MKANELIGFSEFVARRGFSITNLAKVSGVPLTTVASIARSERQFKNATVLNAIKIAAALGVAVEDIYLALYGPVEN